MDNDKTKYFHFSIINSCHITECEPLNVDTFEPNWLPNALPYQNGKPSKCQRFEYVQPLMPNSSTPATSYEPHKNQNKFNDECVCPAIRFNRTNTLRCVDNQFVYKTNELTIVNEVNSRI